jgi:hypothetical protein
MEVNSLLFFLDKLVNFDGVVLTVVKIEVSCGDDRMLFGTPAVVDEDILISELKICEERLDKDPVAVFIVDILIWLSVYLLNDSGSSSQMVSDWFMVNGDGLAELVGEEDNELALEETIESVSFSVLPASISLLGFELLEVLLLVLLSLELFDLGEMLMLAGRLIEDEIPEDSTVELLLCAKETIEEVHEVSWESYGIIWLAIFLSILRAVSSADEEFSFLSFVIQSDDEKSSSLCSCINWRYMLSKW